MVWPTSIKWNIHFAQTTFYTKQSKCHKSNQRHRHPFLFLHPYIWQQHTIGKQKCSQGAKWWLLVMALIKSSPSPTLALWADLCIALKYSSGLHKCALAEVIYLSLSWRTVKDSVEPCLPSTEEHGLHSVSFLHGNTIENQWSCQDCNRTRYKWNALQQHKMSLDIN